MEKVTFQLAAGMPGVGRAGDLVTLSLEPADVHVPEELPNYLAGYKPFGFRADEISPLILVDFDSDFYRTFSADDAFQLVPMKTSNEGKHAQIDLRSSTTKYNMVRRSIGMFINAITEQQSSYNVRQQAMKRLQRSMMLDRENDVLVQATTSTTFASANRVALTSGSEWNGGADSDPIKDLESLIVNSLQEVTDFWMNPKQALTMLRHPSVRDQYRQFKGDDALDADVYNVNKTGGVDTKRDFELPGVGTIHIVAAKANSGAAGGTPSYLFPDGVVVATTTEPGAPVDGETISTFKTFRVRGPSGVGYSVREYIVPDRGAEGGTMIVVSQGDISVTTANNAGGIITGAYA